jgi:hypothetical protein
MAFVLFAEFGFILAPNYGLAQPRLHVPGGIIDLAQ